MSSLASLTALLAIAPYRRFLFASTLVSVSLWAFQVGLSWTLLEESGSAFVVGLLQTAMLVAIPIVTIPAGVLADRLGPRDLIVVCYGALVACVAALALLGAVGGLSVPAALGLAVVFGVFDGLALTPTHVLVGRIVPREHMSAAISFSVIAFGIGRLVGGPLGGTLLAMGGATAALGVAALGILGSCLVLLTIPRPIGLADGAPPRLRDIEEAWRWVHSMRPALTVLLLGAISALCLWPYVALVPVVARDLMAGEAELLGWLVAASGLGAIVAAFITEPLGRAVGRGRLVVGSLVAGGLLVIALALARDAVLALALAVLISTAVVTWTATTNVVLQALAPPSMRGRVLALHGVIFFTAIPIGTVIAGLAADAVGVSPALVVLGLATCVGTTVIVGLDRSLLDRGLVDRTIVGPDPAAVVQTPSGS
jgi:MFS family permease